MDIRNWPLDRILQLPDHCFGRRWPVTVSKGFTAAGFQYDISDMALPEISVLWEIVLSCWGATVTWAAADLRLGDQVPATSAEFLALEYLINEFGGAAITGRAIPFAGGSRVAYRQLRYPVHSAGRRVVARLASDILTAGDVSAVLTFSSIPTEVPDCLLSAHR